MARIVFEDVTIIYNEKDVNEDICKKKYRIMNFLSIMQSTLIVAIIFSLFYFSDYLAHVIPFIVIVILSIVMVFVMIFGGVKLLIQIVYGNSIKAFHFVDWMFWVNDIQACWYNGKILLTVNESCGITYHSLQKFLRNIKNDIVITDESDKNCSIHIVVDVSNNDITRVSIKNSDNLSLINERI